MCTPYNLEGVTLDCAYLGWTGHEYAAWCFDTGYFIRKVALPLVPKPKPTSPMALFEPIHADALERTSFPQNYRRKILILRKINYKGIYRQIHCPISMIWLACFTSYVTSKSIIYTIKCITLVCNYPPSPAIYHWMWSLILYPLVEFYIVLAHANDNMYFLQGDGGYLNWVFDGKSSYKENCCYLAEHPISLCCAWIPYSMFTP